MSNYGFRQKDAMGNIVFDTDRRLIRVIHVERVGPDDPARTIQVPNLRPDRAWWLSIPDAPFTRGPVGALFSGSIQVIGGRAAGTSNSSAGYVVVLGYG